MQELKFNRQFFRDLGALLKPYWTSSQKKTASLLLLANLGCILVEVWGTVGLNDFNKSFFDALGKFDKAAILVSLGHFLFFLAVLILSFGYNNYLTAITSIRWRKWLTTYYLERWLTHHRYYRLQQTVSIDNPDQRISEDLQEFTTLSVSIFFSLIQSALTLCSFGYILWHLSGRITIPFTQLTVPGYLCFSALMYAVLGTFIMTKIGKKLSSLDYQQQKYNADFRFTLVRLRESSEQVAMSGGETAEKHIFDGLFAKIYTNFLDMNIVQKHLNFFSNGYNNVAFVAGILFSMPLYLTKSIELGGLMQISGAFGMVISAFSIFINSFYQLTEWRAVVSRLSEFNYKMDSIQQNNSFKIQRRGLEQ